jgi:O-antigen/teichoic acid export membrane protein
VTGSAVAARSDESTVAHGARWITLAFVIVGLLNYGYALLLTRLLDVAAYSTFAAGQGLILWASTVATVCVPWVLAQGLARAQSEPERRSVTQFAKLVSVASGVSAAALVAVIALRFAAPTAVLAVAISTFVIFLGTTATGWLQGNERMRGLAVLYVAENVLKNGAGILLVVVARLCETGALAAFGIGALVMLARWPRTPRRPGQARDGGSGRRDRWHRDLWRRDLWRRDLWHRAARITGAQSMVSLFVALDVVLVAVLPGNRALAASYQASATLARIPLFVAGAVATAFFPSLSRGERGGALAARALRMYAAVTLPVAAILITVPGHLLALIFPAQYGAVAMLLKFTAVTGFGAGGISLVVAFFQAADDYSCLTWLLVGLVGYAAALVVGWLIDGVMGLAVGGAVGTMSALMLTGYHLVQSQGYRVLSRVTLAEPAVAAAVLIVVRPYLYIWLAAAVAIGLRAGVRFLRPGARHARGSRLVKLTAHAIGSK